MIAFFLLLTVVLTWPLAANLDRAISDPGDPFFTTWAIDWNYHAATTSASLFDANIFHPVKRSLAFSEHMAGMAIFLFPLIALGTPALTAHNIAMIAGFAGCAYAMYLLSRWVTRSTLAGIVGGLAYGFVGFRFHHLPHLHFVWSMWLPVLLLALLMHFERPRIASAALVCAALVLNGLTSAHWLVFGAAALLVSALVLAMSFRRFDLRFWVLLIGALAAAAVILLPFLLPYREVRSAHGTDRLFEEVYQNGAKWRDWFQPYYGSAWYGRLASDEAMGHERTLFPGIAVLLAAVVGLAGTVVRPDPPASRRDALVRNLLDVCIAITAALVILGLMSGLVELSVAGHRLLSFQGSGRASILLLALVAARLLVAPPRWRTAEEEPAESRMKPALAAAAAWMAVGILGARGLRGFFHSALFDTVSIYRGIRMPGRWAMIAFVGLALAASAYASRSARSRRLPAVAILLALAILAESWIRPIRWYMVPNVPRPVYDWIGSVPFRGGILELPMDQWFTYEYLWRATRHHRPLLNGVSSFTPISYKRIADEYAMSPMPDSLFDALEAGGCSLLLVHEGVLRERDADVRDWVNRGLQQGRLTFVRRFAEGGGADYVFALTRNEPQAARWREAERPDPSGRTPSQNLEAFLGNGWAWVGGVMMRVDERPPDRARGKLVISGWLLSDKPVREVRITFANGRHVFPAARFARPDVGALMPWHPDASAAGFRAEIAGPPRGVDGATDMVIDIALENGEVVHTGPALFTWRPAVEAPPRWRDGELAALLHRLGAPAGSDERLRAGSAAIQDFIDPLISMPEFETDARFARRAVETLLGAHDEWLFNRTWREVADGVSRRRAIGRILTSRAFASRHIESGAIALD